nr:hypothetical protein BaRGS_032135 [Batillaria attramentaria]
MLKMPKKPATGRRQPPKGQLKKSEEVLSHILDLINMAPDLAYLAGPPGTGKTLTTVIMSLEWLRQNGTVDILSWTRQHVHYDNSHNNVLQQYRYNDLNR